MLRLAVLAALLAGATGGSSAMKTSQDRILTTHVGSLPRPLELKELLVRKDQGQTYDKDNARLA